LSIHTCPALTIHDFQELSELLEEEKLKNVPVLVFANKQVIFFLEFVGHLSRYFGTTTIFGRFGNFLFGIGTTICGVVKVQLYEKIDIRKRVQSES
jgi:hypothetical protein